eukprot:2467246-Karenia_brevis.AAC.1
MESISGGNKPPANQEFEGHHHRDSSMGKENLGPQKFLWGRAEWNNEARHLCEYVAQGNSIQAV